MQLEEIKLAVDPYIRKLEAFRTPDEIRDFLVQEDVKATPRHPTACAIAVYVRDSSGVGVNVEGQYITACETTITFDSEVHRTAIQVRFPQIADCTPAMEQFIGKFDSGGYPELEDDKNVFL